MVFIIVIIATLTFLFSNLKLPFMLTRILQLSNSTALGKKVHRRQIFALLFGSLPLLSQAKENTIAHPKKIGYGKNAYGG